MPFLLFLTAPLAFRTQRQRQVLLVTFVTLGAYLGLTVVFETVKLDALVFPKYILDPHYGIHAGRGRGPFVEAVTNGLALFTCSVVCAIAVAQWHDRRGAHPGRRHRPALPGRRVPVPRALRLDRSARWRPASGCSRRRARGATWSRVIIAVGIGVGAALIFVPGLHQRVTAARRPEGDALGPQEPGAGGDQHGRRKAAGGLRLGSLSEGQRRTTSSRRPTSR